jgi:hypothetical protein
MDRYKIMFYIDVDSVHYLKIVESHETFIQGRKVAPVFFKNDGFEKFYSLQK